MVTLFISDEASFLRYFRVRHLSFPTANSIGSVITDYLH